MNLKELYEESKGIVHKWRKDYHLQQGEKEGLGPGGYDVPL